MAKEIKEVDTIRFTYHKRAKIMVIEAILASKANEELVQLNVLRERVIVAINLDELAMAPIDCLERELLVNKSGKDNKIWIISSDEIEKSIEVYVSRSFDAIASLYEYRLEVGVIDAEDRTLSLHELVICS